MVLASFLVLLFLYGLISRRLESTAFTAPIVFALVGGVLGWLTPPEQTAKVGLDFYLRLAEVGLVLLLFTDAARTDLRSLRAIGGLPLRLLSVGMLGTVVLGMVLAKWVWPGMSWWEAGVLAAILAPTDAGLGQIVVTSPQVPLRVRQSLAVEAGLNDGLAVPFLLFFVALSAGDGSGGSLGQYAVEQLGYGVLIGVLVGGIGGAALRRGSDWDWVAHEFEPIAVATLPLLAMVISESTGASMFIAAFVAGLAVQVRFPRAAGHGVEFAEQWGQFLNLAVFFLFGMVVARTWGEIGLREMFYALLSLTVIRAVPVIVSLVGTGLSWPTIGFMAWFGPRGLASIVLALVYLEHGWGESEETGVWPVVVGTVGLSVVAHGISARWGMNRYAAFVSGLPETAIEKREATTESLGRETRVAQTLETRALRRRGGSVSGRRGGRY